MNAERKRRKVGIEDAVLEPGPSKQDNPGQFDRVQLQPGGTSKCHLRSLLQQQRIQYDSLPKYSMEDDLPMFCAVFPEEIWLKITEEINDPVTLQNIASASPYLENLIESRRVEYLFPKVLPILNTWISQHHHQEETELESFFDDSDEDIIVRNGWKHQFILVSRLVCPSWEASVNLYLEDNPIQYRLDPESSNPSSMRYFANPYSVCTSEIDRDTIPRNVYRSGDATLPCLKLYDANTIQDFLAEPFPFPERNALFHRCLVIEDYPSGPLTRENTRQYWTAVNSLLERFGSEIWYCVIRLQRNIVNNFTYYFKVREWLNLMPNLKVLQWCYPLQWRDLTTDSEDEFGNQYPIFLRCKLEAKVRENPLPKLSHLQVFKVDDLPYPIFREFLKKNDHLKKLQFHRRFPPTPDYADFFKYDYANGLSNISELSILIWTGNELKELEESTTKWPLMKKLNLVLANHQADVEINGHIQWSRIFDLIQRKCENGCLSSLRLWLPIAYPNDFTENALNRLSLSTIEDVLITAEHSQLYRNLDFLLGCQNLKSLTLGKCYVDKLRKNNEKCQQEKSEKRIIQLEHGFTKRAFSNANIWQLFPRLTTLMIAEPYPRLSGRGYGSFTKFVKQDGQVTVSF